MKRVSFSHNDFGLFDGELNGYDYEFFCKHTGAFKRLMKDEPKEHKQEFVDAFCDFFIKHGEMKPVTSMPDQKQKFVETFREYATKSFVNGKFSASKQFLNDAVTVARHKHMIQYMDSQSYAKDPFFYKETRDVFRRLFGEPSEPGTCIKVICLLPLYVRFAGAICRYLRRWLDADEAPVGSKVATKSQKTKKKEEDKIPKESDSPGVMVFKIDPDGVQEIRRTPSGTHEITRVDDPAYLARAGFPWPQLAERSEYYRTAQSEFEYERRVERQREMLDEAYRAVQQSSMGISTRAQEVAKHVTGIESTLHKLSQISSDTKTPTDKTCGGKTSQNKTSSGKRTDSKTSKNKTEDKVSEGKNSGSQTDENINGDKKVSNVQSKSSEEIPSEGKSSEEKPSVGKCPDEKTPEEKPTVEETSVEKTSVEKTSVEKTAKDKIAEGENSTVTKSEEKSEVIESEVIMAGFCDNTVDDECIRELLPEFHLGEPHPNEIYKNLVEEEKKSKEKIMNTPKTSGETKLRVCAYCKSTESEPKTFKKCQKCKGKGTKFYCCRDCQKKDWPQHRLEHRN